MLPCLLLSKTLIPTDADFRGNRSSIPWAQAAGLGRLVWRELWRRLRSRSLQRRGSQWLPRRSRKHRSGALAFCKVFCCIMLIM